MAVVYTTSVKRIVTTLHNTKTEERKTTLMMNLQLILHPKSHRTINARPSNEWWAEKTKKGKKPKVAVHHAALAFGASVVETLPQSNSTAPRRGPRAARIDPHTSTDLASEQKAKGKGSGKHFCEGKGKGNRNNGKGKDDDRGNASNASGRGS